MATAQKYINRALRLINVLGNGETPDYEDSNNALTTLNDMLALWSIDKLLVYQMQESTHTLVSGTASYTIGSGATIDQSRPARIESAFIRDSNSNDYGIEIINKEDYDLISDKTTQADFPNKLFYDPGFPNGTIYIYPAPSTAYTLHFVDWKPFSSFATLSTAATFPSGYNQLLVYNLAVLLAAEFNVNVRQDVTDIALYTKSKIEDLNNQFQSKKIIFDSVFAKNRSNSDLL